MKERKANKKETNHSIKLEQPPSKSLDALIHKVNLAQQKYSTFSQDQVDKIFYHAALAANKARLLLAKEAVKETNMGLVEDKVIKNQFAAEFIHNQYRNTKTCDEVFYDEVNGIRKIAEPVGVIAGITPITNPTPTIIFKTLIALKTRNGIVFCPHPTAKKSSILAAKIILDAAVKAGAPKDIVGWIENPTIELSQQLMSHHDISLILATGGPGMVHAAYSSGTPAIGVGPGNTPAIVDETAHITTAVSSILLSKTFDNGVICASEQSVIGVKEIYSNLKKELIRQGAYILSKEERSKLSKIILINGMLNPKIVGQTATTIAKLAGFNVPAFAKVLISETKDIGENEPFSHEKLCPILALYNASTFEAAIDTAKKLLEFGGMGHTSVLHTNESNQDRITFFGKHLKTCRLLVNMPSSQGAIGDVYNFRLTPSLSLGCGSYGGNSVSENIGVKHLLNIKTIAERRENTLLFRVPPKIYFKRGCLSGALTELIGCKRALIVTDQTVSDLGYVKKITDILFSYEIKFEIFDSIKPDPDLATVKKGVERMQSFHPDIIIAFGGGSSIDASKIMWLMYEVPNSKFEDITMRFANISKRIYKWPELGKKAKLVAIPTTSGSGSEVTPFATITNEKEEIKYSIMDYGITPNIAIIDPVFVMHMPKKLTAESGFGAITHSIESLAAITATDYSNSLAMESLNLLFKYLLRSYLEGDQNPVAREKIHYASTISGMAFGNTGLGICHSMAHKLGSTFRIPHGVASALLITIVIRYNATDAPRKQGALPQYPSPDAINRYALMADTLNLGGSTPINKVEKLINALRKLRTKLELPNTIKEAGVEEKEFYSKLDELSELAFDDQCTGTNPRYPSIEEIRELYIQAYEGE